MIRPLLLLATCSLLLPAQEGALPCPEEPETIKTEDTVARLLQIHAQGHTSPAGERDQWATIDLPTGRDEVVRLQIFLDQSDFGPGFIDGKAGTFTRLAVENYNDSQGRAGDDLRLMAESHDAVSTVYATAIVPDFVKEYVDPTLPTKKPLQAKRPFMPYRSVGEFMAERYHTSVDLLIELNGSDTVLHATARSPMVVPNIKPFRIETMETGKSYHPDDALSDRHVVIDTEKKQAYIYQIQPNGMSKTQAADSRAVKPCESQPLLVASFPITPGKEEMIPRGFWKLMNSVELPEWRYDPLLLDTGIRGKDSLAIPPGPNNPVGVIWNGLTKSGIGIHGTNNPRTIGRASSAGCIRLANWDASRIPEQVRPGAVVWIK